jgi:hypothetical protein
MAVNTNIAPTPTHQAPPPIDMTYHRSDRFNTEPIRERPVDPRMIGHRYAREDRHAIRVIPDIPDTRHLHASTTANPAGNATGRGTPAGTRYASASG